MPLSFLPLITKKFPRLILICPLFLFLLTNYSYMYDITFHYSFGVTAFLFYATILNLKDLKYNKKYILSFSIICTAMLYYSLVVSYLNNNLTYWLENKENNKEILKILNSIPKESSISSSTFYLPHLSNRKYIYEIYYHENKLDIDYVVFDMRYEDETGNIDFYINNNYEKYIEKEGLILILKRKNT